MFSELMHDYQRNSEVKTRGDTEFQEFRWALSKPIIDRLDQLVGDGYGLTLDEVDHVINYDLKIRMSDEGAAPDEGNE